MDSKNLTKKGKVRLNFLISKSLNVNNQLILFYHFFKNLCTSVILPQSKPSIWDSHETNCIGLYNDFGAKVCCSLVKRWVKAENSLSTFAVEEAVNSEILKSFKKLLSRNKQANFKKLTFHYMGIFFWVAILVNTCVKFTLDIQDHIQSEFHTGRPVLVPKKKCPQKTKSWIVDINLLVSKKEVKRLPPLKNYNFSKCFTWDTS